MPLAIHAHRRHIGDCFPYPMENPMRMRLLAVLAFAATLLSGCGYNQIQINDESVNAAWSEVLNQYKRRADLIPNLVSVVQGYASHEKEVLTRVTEARANVAGMKATPELINDPAAFAKFQKAQGDLGGALSRLLVVAENYPNLKADANFRDLQAQVEGTENRITVARNRYIKSVQEYNVSVRTFPNNLTAMVMGWQTKANFTVEDEKAISAPPAIKFDAPAPPAPPSRRADCRSRCRPSYTVSACAGRSADPALAGAAAGIGRAAEPVPLPTLKARVTDLTNTLDATQRGRLEAQLAAIDRAGRAQIAVLMLPTTQPETIEQFGIRLAEAWKIGHKDADNGIIVIVAKDDRKMRIEVGYGLEGSIPDAIAKRIIVERMAPKFKQGDFFGGLFATTEALDQAISGPASGAASAGDAADRPGRNGRATTAAIIPTGFPGCSAPWSRPACCVICSACSARWRRRPSAAGSASWSSVRLAFAIGAAVLIFLLSFANMFSGGGRRLRRRIFRRGGGFSGGGGSFGGGGASGDW
jgi:LemA protein